jgi:hypothetical protein
MGAPWRGEIARLQWLIRERERETELLRIQFEQYRRAVERKQRRQQQERARPRAESRVSAEQAAEEQKQPAHSGLSYVDVGIVEHAATVGPTAQPDQGQDAQPEQGQDASASEASDEARRSR